MKFEPGKYYVGDLCYVLGDRWDEFCQLTIKGNQCLNGVFQLKDGTTFWHHGTAYGDGAYFDRERREYSVDAGLIGVVRADQIDEGSEEGFGGQIIEFKTSFTPYYENGYFFIGDIVIDTADNDYDEYEDEYAEEN